MKTCVVLTTIGTANLLVDYANNFKKYDHSDVGFIIIGDVKTPNEQNELIAQEIRKLGYEAEYWNIARQKKWLREYPKLAKIIPFNTDNRRNIGFLIAAENGAEKIVSIDDDNYVSENDYLCGHIIVGQTVRMKSVSSKNSWFNPCTMLLTKPDRPIYPRGFPYSKRWSDNATYCDDSGKIVLNMGLWFEHPDVDAVTILNEPIKVVGFKGEQIMLARGTYSPINTQNTCFHVSVLPCYYYVLMGARINGMRIDRYGDIWSGFFLKKVVDHMCKRVSIGHPMAYHRRNIHNYLKDLQAELWGMIITEHLSLKLESLVLNQKTYQDCYMELATNLAQWDIYPNRDVKKYFGKLAKAMEIWIETCDQIL